MKHLLSLLLYRVLLYHGSTARQYTAKYTSTSQNTKSCCMQEVSRYTRTEDTEKTICNGTNVFYTSPETSAATSWTEISTPNVLSAVAFSDTTAHTATAYVTPVFGTKVTTELKSVSGVEKDSKCSNCVTPTGTARVSSSFTKILLAVDATKESNICTMHILRIDTSAVLYRRKSAPLL